MTTPEKSVEEVLKTLLEQHFPKGLCKERGAALLLIAGVNVHITQILQAERQKRDGAVEAERERIKEQLTRPWWKELKRKTNEPGDGFETVVSRVSLKFAIEDIEALTPPNNK